MKENFDIKKAIQSQLEILLDPNLHYDKSVEIGRKVEILHSVYDIFADGDKESTD